LIFPRDFAGACAGVQCSHCRDFEIAVAVSILGSLQRVLPPPCYRGSPESNCGITAIMQLQYLPLRPDLRHRDFLHSAPRPVQKRSETKQGAVAEM
jgi:hypothetical protein